MAPYLNDPEKIQKLKENKSPFRKIIDNFKNTMTTNEILVRPNRLFFFWFDIDDNIEIIKELILTGKSSILEEQRKKVL